MQLPDDWAVVAWWIKATCYALFAAFGGVMGHLMRTLEHGQRPRWGRAALEGGGAGFVGLLMLLLCQAMNLSEQWTGVIVGVSGWLGANVTIRILERVVMKKLGLDDTAPPSEEQRNAGPTP